MRKKRIPSVGDSQSKFRVRRGNVFLAGGSKA